jgi:hypothetical protein
MRKRQRSRSTNNRGRPLVLKFCKRVSILVPIINRLLTRYACQLEVRIAAGKPLPQFEEVAIRASPETLQFGLVFRIDMSAGSGVS